MKKSLVLQGIVALLVVGGLATYVFISSRPEKQSASVGTSLPKLPKLPSTSFERTDEPAVERSYSEYGDRDCSDFSSQREAQRFFEEQGGPDTDYHKLDRDGDGIACESL